LKKIKKIAQIILSLPPVRKGINYLSYFSATIFSSTYFLSIPFHWALPFTFMREQRAVLAGKRHYYKNLRSHHKRTRTPLRRNTHRLEKALIMRPRREVFAKNYIMETVEIYKTSVAQWQDDKSSYDESELTWAHNVLTEYFKAVKHEGIIAAAYDLFQKQSYRPEHLDRAPFERIKKGRIPTYEEMLELSMYRRSVRWFLEKKVNRKDIDEALMVARQSPTACNRLPYEFKIYDDPRLVKMVANTPFGTGGYADNIPVIAVLVGKLESYFSARDRHAIYVDSALAAMSFAFALETKDISTCMINWPDFEPLERKMQKQLGMGIDERPIMLIAIGYADPEAKVPFSQKKDLDTIRSYNNIGK
jgi:nitroreductase